MLNWNGEEYQPSTFATVRVYDFMGEHGRPGDRCYCFMSDESNRWEVLRGLPNSEDSSDLKNKQVASRVGLFGAVGNLAIKEPMVSNLK